MPKAMRIARYTVQDQLQRKSFYVFLAVAVLLVLSLRGCYDASYVVNNQPVTGVAVAWHASLFAFHLIAGCMLLFAVLIAMHIFTTEQNDGSMVMYLSRPVSRPQYVMGRIAGLWVLVSVFMFMLHATIFLIAWQKTGGIIPGYLFASLICCANLFFVIALSSLLSLFMPGFITALTVLAVIVAGFLSDGGHRVMSSQMAKGLFNGFGAADLPLWRMLYPKLYMVQHYAVTLISKDEFQAIGPVHPLVNVLLFCAVIVAVLLFVFDRKEV